MPPPLRHLHDGTTPRRWSTLAGVMAVLSAMLLTGCAGSLPESGGGVTCPPIIEAPALYPGDTWTFRYEDGKRWRQTYSSRTEDGLLYGLGEKAQANYFYDQTHTLRKVINQGMALTTANPDYPLIGNPVLVFPLAVGKTWTWTYYSDMRVVIRRSYEVLRCEEVIVPAGTFLAVGIEVSDTYTKEPAAAGRDFTLWYAPKVKYWVKRTSGRATFWNPIPGWELESFRIDSGTPKTK